MNNTMQTAYYANSLSDVLYHLKNVSGLVIFGGFTAERQETGAPVMRIADSFLSVRDVPELQKITKTERFIEFGSAVTLAQILELEQKKIPPALHKAILSMSNPFIRMLSTLTGNLCCKNRRMTTYAPLLAIDARIECMNSLGASISIPLTQFSQSEGNSFVSKIRVPNDEWDISVFRRTESGFPDENDLSFCFLANTQKSILTDVRVAFCGPFTFRSRELENSLIGTKLPLGERTIELFCEKAARYFAATFEKNNTVCPPIVANYFTNLLQEAVRYLS